MIGGPGIRAVVNSPNLSNLRELELWGNYVGTVGCEILASAPSPRRLISLDLGDANLDGKVGFADLLLLAQNYGKKDNANWDQGDFNYDGKVTFADLLLLAQNYGTSVNPMASHRKRP